MFWRNFLILLICVIFFFGEPVYGDERRAITFMDAAALAVTSSAELRAEYKGQKIMENAWVWGLRSYFPRLSIGVQENDRLQEFGADSFLKNYSIGMDQLLWDGGRLSMSRKLERMEINVSNARIERMAGDLAEAALTAYRNVLSARTVLVIREKAFESMRGQLTILEKEVELGLALPLDLAEAELALTEARIEIIVLESNLLEMERQFAELLGLDVLPALAETVDINRAAVLPSARASISLAHEQNPELAEAMFSITKKQTELSYASRSWIPTIRLNGSIALSGNTYPLNRYGWSVGLSVEFASPWLQDTFSFQSGVESPRDRTASLQNNASPLPNPAAGLGIKQAELALALERERYALAWERLGRSAKRTLEMCRLAEQKRRISVEAISMAARRYNLEEIRLGLGQITRLELMKAHLVYTEKEIAAVEAAINLLQAERELERLLNLPPGELAAFASAGILSDADESELNLQILFGGNL
jgi:outer membrane protein TolC